MVKSVPYEWDPTAALNTDVGGNNINEGCAPSSVNNAIREVMAQTRTAMDTGNLMGTEYLTKSAGYTAVAADRGKTINCTATLTLALTAAATLGTGWICTVKANGGDVTIDPNGAETINGASTYIVYDGRSVTVICDGTNFQIAAVPAVPAVWEHIETQPASGATDVTFTGLSAYRTLRATIFVTVSVDAEVLYAQTSVSGTFSTAAAGYITQSVNGFSSSVNSAASTGMRVTSTIGNAGAEAAVANVTFYEFNQGSVCFYVSDTFCLGDSASLPIKSQIGGYRNDTSARDGLRFVPGSGTISGVITLEGIRS